MKNDMSASAAATDPRPVFIVGGSRTGSEMLKTMLSASPRLDFVDEMFLYCPRWLHRDLASHLDERFGGLGDAVPARELVDFLYSGTPYGWFWSNTLQEIDRDALLGELAPGKQDMRALFLAIMRAHAGHNGKSGLGAKFPLHYSQTDRLLTWFPGCRIIHTTRNPQAVYASQSAKYISPEQSAPSRVWTKFQHFVHINIQTTWTARVHRRLSGRKNYLLVRYEDVVTDPEAALRTICRFLDVPFLDDMTRPKQYGSSFGTIAGSHGVSASSLDRWKSGVSPVVQRLNALLHPRAFRLLGYGNGGR